MHAYHLIFDYDCHGYFYFTVFFFFLIMVIFWGYLVVSIVVFLLATFFIVFNCLVSQSLLLPIQRILCAQNGNGLMSCKT